MIKEYLLKLKDLVLENKKLLGLAGVAAAVAVLLLRGC